MPLSRESKKKKEASVFKKKKNRKNVCVSSPTANGLLIAQNNYLIPLSNRTPSNGDWAFFRLSPSKMYSGGWLEGEGGVWAG